MSARALVAAAIVLLAATCVSATKTLKTFTLSVTCTVDDCPDRQCWNISLPNPFGHRASWSATLSAYGAVDVSARDNGLDAEVLTTENEGSFAFEWEGSRNRCSDKESSPEICISGAATASTPLLLVTHDDNPDLCDALEPVAEEKPQFIIVSWDDAFTHVEFKDHLFQLLHENRDIRDWCGGHPRHTFFISNDNTDYAAMSHVLNYGAEYALHTVRHQDVTPMEVYWNKQIDSGIRWAERLVPSIKERKEWKPKGFRAPWLAHSDALFDAIQNSGQLLYDSSLLSPRPIWPYPLEDGAHDGCQRSASNDSCPKPGIYHDVWEFPVNPLISEDNEIVFFDPSGTPIEIWRLLRHHLHSVYESNRAPMMLSLHSRQFFDFDAAQKRQILRNFFLLVEHEYAGVGKKVIFATMHDVVQWIKAGSPSSNKEELCSYFRLPHAEHAPSPEHQEVCDGWDNNGNGQFDEYLINTCRYPQQDRATEKGVKRLRTCAPCPFHYPTDDGPDELDMGQDHTKKGNSTTTFRFSESDSGHQHFTAFIEIQNPHVSPSQHWQLKLDLNHISIDSYYGATPSEPYSDKFHPTVLRFENTHENFYVTSYGEQKGIEIGGKIELGMEDRCIDDTQNRLREECWQLVVYFSQETAPRRIALI